MIRPLAFTALAAFASPAFADPFSDAVRAANSGAIAQAVVQFRSLALSGDARAQTNLAVLHAKGEGTPQDEVEAYYWAWRARLAGETRAIPVIDYLAPRLTEESVGTVSKRLIGDLAIDAEKGDASGFLGIGRVYAQLAEPEDKPEAAVWFTVAAAFNVKFAAILRDTIAGELTRDERTEVQVRAKAKFQEWCGRVPMETRPASCSEV